MVRILKVGKLQHRKQILLAKSEIYRQTLKLEFGNIKVASAVIRRKFNLVHMMFRFLGAAAPMAGIFLAQKLRRREPAGFIPRLVSTFALLKRLGPMIQSFWHGRRKHHNEWMRFN